MPEFDFGHFHILDELGRGGMALVYRAIDTRTEETVALKILYPHLMSDDRTIKRFQREARVAGQLKHPNIVPVVDFGHHNDQIYIAMKYMAGNSLADRFAEPQSIVMADLLRILEEIASALDYAHQEGVIHRDLKLQNILLDDEGHAHLADFGIARLVDSTRLTATGQVAGTPMYMSPEQIRGKQVDYKSDIYSFSVMCYLLLTGYYPFTGEDSLAIIHKHVKEFPPPPTEVNPELPVGVNLILLRGLMKDPDSRYDTTMEVVDALRQAIVDKDLHKTTTRIDIHALNPVDSIEIDASSSSGERVSSPSPTTSQGLRAASISGEVNTGNLVTGKQRTGIFMIPFAVLAVAVIGVIIFFVIQASSPQSIEIEYHPNFGTGLCDIITKETYPNDFVEEEITQRDVDCTGTISTRTVLLTAPGPQGSVIGDPFEAGTSVYITGTDAFEIMLFVTINPETSGWMHSCFIDEMIAIEDLPNLLGEPDGGSPPPVASCSTIDPLQPNQFGQQDNNARPNNNQRPPQQNPPPPNSGG